MGPRRVKFLIALAAGLLAIPLSYWLYRGLAVFRDELRGCAISSAPDESVLRDSRATSAGLREVSWRLPDGSKQRAFYLPPSNGAVVVYAHGAAGNGLALLPEALAMAEHGFGALLLDLPGYGRSEGRNDWGPGFQATIRAAVDFAVRQPGVNPRGIGAFGYSMGGYAMARAAADDGRIAGLVLLAAYTDLSDLLHFERRSRVPGLGYFAIAADAWYGIPIAEMDTRVALRRLGGRPVFIIAGGADIAIPVSMSEELLSAATNAKRWVVEEAGHTGFADRAGQAYFARLLGFWTTALSRKTASARP